MQTFQAFTSDIQRMAAWLLSLSIETIVMESTGVYWVPVFEVLESAGIDVIVANARETRSVPGRKSDINDAQWLQRLNAGGLLRASFRHGRDIAALRACLRHRERLLDYAAAHIQHISGLFESWVTQCPLNWKSPNAPSKRDVLGTVMLSILSVYQYLMDYCISKETLVKRFDFYFMTSAP